MKTLVNLWIFTFFITQINSAVPNYKGCEFYMDKMTQLYGQHFPRSNSIFRDPNSDGVEGFFKFLRKPGDLAIVMDRSEGFSAYFFYLMQRPLVEFILRNHIAMDRNHTRLALLTFARDLTVLYDGISYDSDLEKCTLLQDGGPWSEALYNRDPDVSQGTYIDQALDKAFDILTNSPRQVPRTILVVTDGSWNSDRNPRIEHVMTLIKNAGIEVYSMMSGVYGISQYGNVKDVATAKDHYAEETKWVEAALSVTPAIKWFTPGAPWSCPKDNCCHPAAGNVSETNPGTCRQYKCQNGGLCVDGNGVATCLCQLGFHGYQCQYSVDDCLQDACPRETECEDNHHRFTCTCPNKTEECLEVVKGLCGYNPDKFKDTLSTDENDRYRNYPENGTMPTWNTGASTTIHQYHFISINAIIAIACICLVVFFVLLAVGFGICARRGRAYQEHRKRCFCCVKAPPEVPQTLANSTLPGPSVSMETYPGAVANPVLEVDDLPPKFGLRESDENGTSDSRGSQSETARSSIPSISQTMEGSLGLKPPPYSSLYLGTSKPKMNRRDSQQPLLVPASPDSIASTSTCPLPDIYPQFDPDSNDRNLDNTDDPDLHNNNNVSQERQPQRNEFDMNNFMDLPVNANINYENEMAATN